MTEGALHLGLVLGVIAAALVVASALTRVNAPYGRFGGDGGGATIPDRLAWLIMESPAWLGFAAVYGVGRNAFEAAPLALAAIWLTHYLFRGLVYPLRGRAGGHPMPAAIVVGGFGFNAVNAYLIARWVSHLGDYPASWLTGPRFLGGTALFFAGMAVNRRADAILAGLRAHGESGYRIPRGWLYDRVASPNYLGEIVQWAGFAVATWSPAGAAFAIFTAANLIPRAFANRRWYREHFPDHATDRKALIPYLW